MGIDTSKFSEEAKQAIAYSYIQEFIKKNSLNGEFDMERLTTKECFEAMEVLTGIVLG